MFFIACCIWRQSSESFCLFGQRCQWLHFGCLVRHRDIPNQRDHSARVCWTKKTIGVETLISDSLFLLPFCCLMSHVCLGQGFVWWLKWTFHPFWLLALWLMTGIGRPMKIPAAYLIFAYDFSPWRSTQSAISYWPFLFQEVWNHWLKICLPYFPRLIAFFADTYCLIGQHHTDCCNWVELTTNAQRSFLSLWVVRP